MNEAPFKPTECDCVIDQQNCKTQPGYLIPGELQRILAHLNATMSDAAKWFWNSPGMVLMKAGQMFRVRTITPRFENGKCIFFENGRCTIHSVAPYGCRYFDVHMGQQEGYKRSAWGATQVMTALADYSAERDTLPEATHYAPKATR